MPWEPLRELRAWQERMERLSAHHPEAWTPPIDVYETDTAFVVSVELPGLAREDIELELAASRLTIRGRRRARPEAAAAVTHFHQVERAHGAFARSFEFAAPIDVAAVAADLANGVLTVTLPKTPAAPLRTIEVR